VKCKATTMSVDGGIQHQPRSTPSSSSSPSSAAVAVRVGVRHVTDHSVKSLLESSSPVDQSYFTPVHHLSHAPLIHPHPAASAAVMLPSADDPMASTQLYGHVSFHGADVTDCDVSDCAASVLLEHKELWDRFNVLGTEMVITKSGR